jgi:hypothetical protein
MKEKWQILIALLVLAFMILALYYRIQSGCLPPAMRTGTEWQANNDIMMEDCLEMEKIDGGSLTKWENEVCWQLMPVQGCGYSIFG